MAKFTDEEIDTLVELVKKQYDQASYVLNGTLPYDVKTNPDDKFDHLMFEDRLKTKIAKSIKLLQKLDRLRDDQE